MGWSEGQALGKDGDGCVEPVSHSTVPVLVLCLEFLSFHSLG